MLILGKNKELLLEHLPSSFLVIDDGNFIDQIQIPARRKITRFDFKKHFFNPIKDISYRGARDFIAILNAIFPEGENTLTRKNSNFALLSALLAKPKSLDRLLAPSEDAGVQDAYQKIQTLLLSPVLRRILTGSTNFSMKSIVLARLDRKVLGDFDAFVIGQLLLGQYPGHIVVPDYGFYACPFHIPLVRERKLFAGLNFLDEVSEDIKKQFLLGEILPSHALYDDAETLALHAGIARGTNAFLDFVNNAL